MTIKTVKASGGDYTSIQAAIDACPSNITAGGTNETWEIECYASIGVQAPITISGKTTDATHYIRIYAPVGQRHLGKPDSTSVRIGTEYYNYAIECAVNNLIVEGIQFSGNTGNGNPEGGIHFTSAASIGHEVRECLFVGCEYPSIIVDNATGGTLKVRNCIHFGAESSASFIRNASASGCTTYAYNCTGRSLTSFDYFYLYHNEVGTMVCKNCVAVITSPGTGAACFNGTVSGNNNVSSDASAPGTGSQTSVTPTFVDAANGDLHLSPSDTIAKAHGADLHADANYAFNIDIDGGSRPDGAWDAGADQLAGGGQAARSIHMLNQMRA